MSLSSPVSIHDDALTFFFQDLPYPTLPYPALPYPTLPYPTLPYPTLPYLVRKQNRRKPCPALPYPALPYPTLPYPPYPTLPPLPVPSNLGCVDLEKILSDDIGVRPPERKDNSLNGWRDPTQRIYLSVSLCVFLFLRVFQMSDSFEYVFQIKNKMLLAKYSFMGIRISKIF
jgi:hypothetical protein